MKFKRILIALLILCTLLSVFTINIFAASIYEGAEHLYIHIDGVDRWLPYREHYDNWAQLIKNSIDYNDFTQSVGGYISLYGNLLTYNDKIVYASDSIVTADKGSYREYSLDDLIFFENDCVTFHEVLRTITFNTLGSLSNGNVYNHNIKVFHYDRENEYITINDKLLYDTVENSYVFINTRIVPGRVYELHDTVHEHIWVTNGYIRYPTCQDNGYGYLICELCFAEKEGEIPASDYFHKYREPTCLEPAKCILCGDEGRKATGHSFVAPTCTEKGYCKTCGVTNGLPVGHDYNWYGKCKNCGDVNISTAFAQGYHNFYQKFNHIKEDVTEKAEDIKEDIKEKIQLAVQYVFLGDDGKGLFANLGFTQNDDKLGFDDVWRLLVIVLCTIPIIALIYFVIVVIIKIKGKINTMPKEKKRKRRKRKKV